MKGFIKILRQNIACNRLWKVYTCYSNSVARQIYLLLMFPGTTFLPSKNVAWDDKTDRISRCLCTYPQFSCAQTAPNLPQCLNIIWAYLDYPCSTSTSFLFTQTKWDETKKKNNNELATCFSAAFPEVSWGFREKRLLCDWLTVKDQSQKLNSLAWPGITPSRK